MSKNTEGLVYPGQYRGSGTSLTYPDRIQKGLADFDSAKYYSHIPHPASNFLAIENALIKYSSEGVTLFGGGPLDLRRHGISRAWVSPVEVEDGEGATSFHVLMLNCGPEDNLTEVPVAINLAPEICIKLGDVNSAATQQFYNALYHSDCSPQIIVRPSLTGSLAYPLMNHPANLPSPEQLQRRLRQMKRRLPGLKQMKLSEVDFEAIQKGEFKLWGEYEHCMIGEPQIIQTDHGLVYVYGILSADDPWEYYEMISTEPFKQLRARSHQTVRVDSGCDSGMLYGDGGCDCHNQLLAALDETRLHGGFVIHCPTQDGRGYGMVTKMETEAWKHGDQRGILNKGKPPMDTVEVARQIFNGGEYDLRTYVDVARILVELGIRNLTLITDNIRKFQQLDSHPDLTIERRATESEQDPRNSGCITHIQAKRSSSRYFG